MQDNTNDETTTATPLTDAENATTSCGARAFPDLRCPDCGGTVESTGNGPGWMSADQWDSAKAGDYFCTGACEDQERENGLVYFWSREVAAASVCAAGEAAQP